MIPLINGELVKVRTTRTALGFGAAAVLLVLALVLISFLAGDPRTVDEKRDALIVGGVLSVPMLIFGIVGALIWLFILSPVLGLIDDDLPDYTTLPAAGIVGGSTDASGLSYGTAVIVLIAWAVVFVVAGLLLERRRDVD